MEQLLSKHADFQLKHGEKLTDGCNRKTVENSNNLQT